MGFVAYLAAGVVAASVVPPASGVLTRLPGRTGAVVVSESGVIGLAASGEQSARNDKRDAGADE